MACDSVVMELIDTISTNKLINTRIEDNRCFLSGAYFSSFSSPEEVKESTTELVSALEGFIRLTVGRKISIEISTITEIMLDGSKHDYVYFEEKIELKSSMTLEVTHADGTVKVLGPKQVFSEHAMLCVSSPEFAQALNIYGNGTLQWSDLFKVYELIADNCGGTSELIARGWTRKKDIERFKRSANDPSISGISARHAVFRYDPLKNPMKILEGRAFIDSLLYKWIEVLG